MEPGGLVLMVASVGGVILLNALCFWWVLRTPDPRNGA